MDDPAQRAHRLSEHDRAAISALADKYERVRALRDELGRGTPSDEHRARLRSLSRDYPGSLRELETLTTDEIELRQRLTSLVVDEAPAWLLWTAAYHAAIREDLHARSGGERSASPHGRLNAKVFAALGQRFGVDGNLVWDTLFPRRGAVARPYR